MQEFFYMDGKWMFVWGSYGFTMLGLVLCIVFANSRKKKLFSEIEEGLKE